MSANYFDSNESKKISDLTIENSEDKIIIYGDIDITRDKEGLNNLNELLNYLNGIKLKMDSEDLPEKIESKSSEIVNNPFKK